MILGHTSESAPEPHISVNEPDFTVSTDVKTTTPETIMLESEETAQEQTMTSTEPPHKLRRMGHTKITTPIITNISTSTQTPLLGTHERKPMAPHTPHTHPLYHVQAPINTPLTKVYFLTDIPLASRHEAGLVLDEMWGNVVRRYNKQNTHPPGPSLQPQNVDVQHSTPITPTTPTNASSNDSLLGPYSYVH